MVSRRRRRRAELVDGSVDAVGSDQDGLFVQSFLLLQQSQSITKRHNGGFFSGCRRQPVQQQQQQRREFCYNSTSDRSESFVADDDRRFGVFSSDVPRRVGCRVGCRVGFLADAGRRIDARHWLPIPARFRLWSVEYVDFESSSLVADDAVSSVHHEILQYDAVSDVDRRHGNGPSVEM